MCNTHVRVQVPPRAPKGTSPDWARSFFISFFHVAKRRLPALAHQLQGAVQEQGQLQGAAEAFLLAALGPEDGALPAGVLPEEDADIKGGQLPRRTLLHLAMSLLRLHHRAKAPHGGKSLGRQLLVQEMLHLLEKIQQIQVLDMTEECLLQVSGGVAVYEDSMEMQDWFERAEQKLQLARYNGGNQVIM